MGLKLCYFVLDIRGDARPRLPMVEALPRLFELWLADFCAPRVLSFWLDGAPAPELSGLDRTQQVGGQTLWTGERIVPGSPLTRCGPEDSVALIDSAGELLAARTPDDIYLHVEGALRHLAVGDMEPHWYGRWYTTPPPMLTGLVEIRLQWSTERRNLEISFPQSGYPLTSVALLESGELGPGDPRVAAANRAAIVPALARAPLALGLTASEVRWSIEGDFSGLYPDDAMALFERWLPILHGSTSADGVTGKEVPSPAHPTGAHPDSATSVLEALAAGGLRRVWALENLVSEPADDPRVTAAIETALSDTSPCRIDWYYVGEVRLLAGLALTAERAARGDMAPFRLRCVPPIAAGDLMTLLETAGLAWPEPAEDAAVTAFTVARDRGLVVEQDLELAYPVDVAALAAGWRSYVEQAADDAATPADSAATIDGPAPDAGRRATEEDVRFYLDVLTGRDPDERVFALRALAGAPTGDPRVNAALVPLLRDTTPVVLQIPYRFGELRLLAGAALAAERWAAGDDRSVHLRCVAPLTPDELEAVRAATRVPAPPDGADPLDRQLTLFALLREKGLLAEVELELRHPVHIGWLGAPGSLLQ